jgi:hypothetical protein
MKSGPPNDPFQDVPLDENDSVWRLLGRASRPEPDAWFAVRTVARCHRETSKKAGTVSLGQLWRWALGGGLGLSMAVALVVTQIHSHKQAAKQKKVQEAFEIMASLDSDSDSSSSSSSWPDSSF